MPQSLQNSLLNLKSQTKTPIWTFALLAILIGLIVLGVFAGKQKEQRNAKLIIAPQVGDIYEVEDGSEYTLYSVTKVTTDSVFIAPSEYAVTKKSGVEGLKSKSYSSNIIGFSKTEIKDMFGKKKIFDIDRK